MLRVVCGEVAGLALGKEHYIRQKGQHECQPKGLGSSGQWGRGEALSRLEGRQSLGTWKGLGYSFPIAAITAHCHKRSDLKQHTFIT